MDMEPGQLQILKALRKAIRADGRPLQRISRESGVPYAVVHRVNDENEQEKGISVETACKLADTLGLRLELRAIRKGKAKGR